MTTPSERLLTVGELKALKIAAHRQLRRWNNQQLRGELDRPGRRDDLHRAVQWLDAYERGPELS
jgi:hypothetical protein